MNECRACGIAKCKNTNDAIQGPKCKFNIDNTFTNGRKFKPSLELSEFLHKYKMTSNHHLFNINNVLFNKQHH